MPSSPTRLVAMTALVLVRVLYMERYMHIIIYKYSPLHTPPEVRMSDDPIDLVDNNFLSKVMRFDIIIVPHTCVELVGSVSRVHVARETAVRRFMFVLICVNGIVLQ
jgi:hypothetical protein